MRSSCTSWCDPAFSPWPSTAFHCLSFACFHCLSVAKTLPFTCDSAHRSRRSARPGKRRRRRLRVKKRPTVSDELRSATRKTIGTRETHGASRVLFSAALAAAIAGSVASAEAGTAGREAKAASRRVRRNACHVEKRLVFALPLPAVSPSKRVSCALPLLAASPSKNHGRF